MMNWQPLGGEWTWTKAGDDIWLRHVCHPGRIRTGVASDSHTVVSDQPLTLSPSVVCECGAHGFIRDGKWQAV